jgi:transposase-like protein
MAPTHYKGLLKKVLLGFITEQDPVLAMLEWVARQMMLIEAEAKVGAEKGKHSADRQTYFSGARVRRMDTRLGTLQYLFPFIPRNVPE